MKKSLVSALTTALVVGAASTTFAAANPFADVPADHWAYEAVAELADQGVIDGYGDGTYRGQQQITRYEMAQMIARAMAKGQNSAALDKLAAEFADELNSLGVRVANLEKKVGNVKFYGELRYTFRRYINISGGATPDKYEKGVRTDRSNGHELRFKTDATVNKNWHVKNGVYYYGNSKTAADISGANNGDIVMEYLYAQGKYGKATIDLGKFEIYSLPSEGLTFDTQVSGIQVNYGSKLNVNLAAGRYNSSDMWLVDGGTGTVDLQSIMATYDNGKFKIGAGYSHLGGRDVWAPVTGKKEADIWEVGAGYRFNKNLRLFAAYSQNATKDSSFVSDGCRLDSKNCKAYNIELLYKGAELGKRGSYGARLAYKHLGKAAIPFITYDYVEPNMKAFEISGEYMFDKNILGMFGYANGKIIDADKNCEFLFSRFKFFF